MQTEKATTASDNAAEESIVKDPGPSSGDETRPVDIPRPREIGGREGPDPTRYGDWEKNGRCIDF